MLTDAVPALEGFVADTARPLSCVRMDLECALRAKRPLALEAVMVVRTLDIVLRQSPPRGERSYVTLVADKVTGRAKVLLEGLLGTK